MKVILCILILCLLPIISYAGPLTSTFDLEHDLMYVGAGALAISAPNIVLDLVERYSSPHRQLSPWTHIAIETGFNLGLQLGYQAAANNKSPGQQTERVICGTLGGLLISLQFHWTLGHGLIPIGKPTIFN